MRTVNLPISLRFCIWYAIDFARRFTADNDSLDQALMDLSGHFATANEVEILLGALAADQYTLSEREN
jgi:hypothetical protein